MSNESGQFIFSPRILDHLGISAYNSVRKCLAELVANAYDADAHNVDITLPDVIDENAVITISDDGMGMTTEDVKTKFLHTWPESSSRGRKDTEWSPRCRK